MRARIDRNHPRGRAALVTDDFKHRLWPGSPNIDVRAVGRERRKAVVSVCPRAGQTPPSGTEAHSATRDRRRIESLLRGRAVIDSVVWHSTKVGRIVAAEADRAR